MSFSQDFLNECQQLIALINPSDIEKAVALLYTLKQDRGRLFIVGSGGGAGHASHAVCDFRKLCNIETYSPYDNVSELTARVNDEGWEVSLSNWLKVSNFNSHDALLVISVGGGNKEKNVSPNIVSALELAKNVGAKVIGLVGKDGGYTKIVADATLLIPTVNQNHITPLTEGFQAVLWHLLVSHPLLQVNATKWESVDQQPNSQLNPLRA